MMQLKKTVAVILCFALIFTFTLSALADGVEEETQSAYANVVTEYMSDDLMDPLETETQVDAAAAGAPAVNAKSAVLLEGSTGKVIYEVNPHEKVSPASITKIMSILLIIEAIESKRISLEDTVVVSPHAASMGGSQIWLEPGESMGVADLLKATVVGSANDATTALAEHVAGSEETFVALMNQRAAQLEMNDTAFMNCTGLDAEGHYTSAYDVALASRELIKYDLVKEYSTIWMDSLRNGETELVNTNKLVRFYEGCTGLKTGTTSLAGSCLSATATRDDMDLVAVIMGSPTSNDRFEGARKMLDYGFANWSIVPVEITEDEITPVPVKHGTSHEVMVKPVEKLDVLVQKGREEEIEKRVELLEEIEAPVAEDQVIGKVTLSLDGETVAEVQLFAAMEVEKMSLWRGFYRLMMSLFTL